ncbi:MAG: hypothetical protein N3A63_09080 [Bacteroidetes bacterium]|nr:hypothetical protein [Bacteroidota bacterium]
MRSYDEWNIELQQTVSSRLFRSSTISRQDEHTGTIVVNREANDWLTYSVKYFSQVLSTNQPFDVGAMSIHRIRGGVVLEPSSLWSVGIRAGYERNTQATQCDDGATTEFWIRNPLFLLDEFRSSILVNYEYSHLTRRRPYDGELQLSLWRNFDEAVTDSLSVSYQRQRSEFYCTSDQAVRELYGIDKNILQRTYDHFQLTNSIAYRVGNTMIWRLTTSYGRRVVLRSLQNKAFHYYYGNTQLDTKVLENVLALQTELGWTIMPWYRTTLSLFYAEREETHSILGDQNAPVPLVEKQKLETRRLDNISRRTTLTTKNGFVVTRKDSVYVGASLSILRYDTPDTTNTNDRDELWINAGVEYVHRFSDRYITTARFDVYLNHLVYLSRKQSANNNWNRVVRLEWCNIYQPSNNIRTVLCSEVLANYTVSDFEKYIQNVKSYVLRQYHIEDTTIISMTKNMGMELSLGARFSERGHLRWKEFRVQPEQYFHEYSGESRIFYLPYSSLIMKFGYKIFRQERYGWINRRKVLEQRIQSYGPIVSCTLSSRTCNVVLEGWYENQVVNSIIVSRIPNISLTTFYTL